jgi:hypothetical protein
MEFVYLRSSVSRLQKSSQSTQSSRSIDSRVRFTFLSKASEGEIMPDTGESQAQNVAERMV